MSGFDTGDAVTKDTSILVLQGTTLAATAWAVNPAVATVGTNDVTWVQFASSIAAGSGLTLSGGAYNVNTIGTTGNIYINGSNQVDVNGALSIVNGGTNTTAFSDTNYLVEYDGTGLATTVPTSSVLTTTNSQTVTNKIINSSTNTVSADALWDKTGTAVVINNAPTVLDQVLKLTNLSPLQAQWEAESTDINGTTAETTPDNADEILIYDNTASANRKMTRANFLTGITAALPTGIIIVAAANGDYTTITAGLAAASSGDTVLVYPGLYAESVTIPDGVRLLGFPAALQVRITGADTTSTRVTFAGGGTLREITVVGPSAGSNPIVDTSASTVTQLCIMYVTVLLGGGGTNTGAGFAINGAGTGVFLTVFHNGGAIGGPFISHTSGSVIGNNPIVNAGSCTAVISSASSGSCQLQGVQLNAATSYSCTDIFNVSGTGDFEIDSLVVPDDSPAINGLHITGDGVNVSVSSCHFHTTSGGFDVLVDGGLTGSLSEVTLVACEFQREKVMYPSGYKNGCKAFNASGADKGIEEDPSYVVDGELAVGTSDHPSEFSAGEGDSTVTNMFVFSFNPAGSVFTDNTAAAKSRVESTFPLFADVASGNIAYIGNLDRKFGSVKVDQTVAIVGSSYVTEYWNGAWTAFNAMATSAVSPYEQRANNLFTTTSSEHIRMDTGIETDWITTTVNSQAAYWIRVRLTEGITTSPTLQRAKLGTNHTEINKDGFVEYFGNSEPEHDLTIGTNYQSVGSVSTATLDVSASISSLTLPVSSLDAFQNSGFAYKFSIPNGTDTSRPLTVEVEWVPSTLLNGNVELTATVCVGIGTGSTINSGSYPEEMQSSIIPVPLFADGVVITTTFTFDISSDMTGDTTILQISRDAMSGNDTYFGSVFVLNTIVKSIRWRP